MPEFKKLNDDISVCGQLNVGDLVSVAEAGFRSIICNRPDNESDEEQPAFADISTEAQRLGLSTAYLPVNPKAITETNVADFAELAKQMPGPVLAYCRTGARCGILAKSANLL